MDDEVSEAHRDTIEWLNTIKEEHAHIAVFEEGALFENEKVVEHMLKGTALDVDAVNVISQSMAENGMIAVGRLGLLTPQKFTAAMGAVVRGMWLDGCAFGAQHQRRQFRGEANL